jgi:lipopolysaccharide/colanic/teichoic acid biosynthesis glycosyltransferase
VRAERLRAAQARAVGVARSALKRGLDVTVAALALALLAPLFVIIAIVVALDSPGPVFYRAERVGRGGRPLRMLKFRKMRVDATGGLLTLAGDDRFTRTGGWLARTKLDELPQLWHVLRGDMSLVGPRPETADHVACFAAEYERILRVRPGLTGFTQLAYVQESSLLDARDPEGHYVTVLLPHKVRLDGLYATRLSTRRDLRILGATAVTLIFRQPVAVDPITSSLTVRFRAATQPAEDRATTAAGSSGAAGARIPLCEVDVDA